MGIWIFLSSRVSEPQKQCRRCLVAQPLSAFSRRSVERDGLNTVCRTCARAQAKAWRDANPGKVRETKRRSREKPASKTQRREAYRKWASANREQRATYMKRWRRKNHPRVVAAAAVWAEANPEKAARSRREAAKRAGHRHPEKLAARAAVAIAKAGGRLLTGRCEVCGSTRVEAHHEDYAKPLEVRWFCRKHHMLLHRKRRWEATP